MKGLVAILLIAASGLSQSTPRGTDLPVPIRELFDKRQYPETIAGLTELRRVEPKRFGDSGGDFLLARLYEREGRVGAALAAHEDVIQNDSDLEIYSVRRAARIARSSGNLLLERVILLRALHDRQNASALQRRLAENALEAGNGGEAIRQMTAAVSKDADISRDDQALLGSAYLAAGSTERGRAIYDQLLSTLGDPWRPDDAAIRAARALDALGGELTEEQHLRRAAVYQAERDFAAARGHYQSVIEAGNSAAAESVLQVARGYALSGDHAEAVNWFERVLERYPSSPTAKDALLQLAAAYTRVGKPKEAITRYQRYIEQYPADAKLDRAYMNIVDLHRDLGADQDALKWCAKAEEAFKDKPPQALAIFAQARIHIAREDWNAALTALDRLRVLPELGSDSPGGATRDEVAFLRGSALEHLHRYPEAIAAYLALSEGRSSYYGWRASETLARLAKNDESRGYVDQAIGSNVAALRSKDPAAKRAAAGAVLRLSENPELRSRALAAMKEAVKPIAFLATPVERDAVEAKLLRLGFGDDVYPEGPARHDIAMMEPVFRNIPPDYPVDLLPRDKLRRLYPVGQEAELLRFAKANRLDPRLVLAIIRQESRFDAEARSSASARGLMQLIMSTAATSAGELGLGPIRPDDLLDAKTSLRLGTRYLADLFKLFPEQPSAVVAAYNGGEDNVKRWTARARTNDPDRYVAEIMFSQTKDYVEMVMANYRMYQYLYDEELNPK